jgi:hypothetical protein
MRQSEYGSDGNNQFSVLMFGVVARKGTAADLLAFFSALQKLTHPASSWSAQPVWKANQLTICSSALSLIQTRERVSDCHRLRR